MEIELHIETLEKERRWNRLQSLGALGNLGRFLGYRDDQTLVWLHDGHAANGHPLVVQSTVRTLTPARGANLTEPDHFRRLAELPVIEVRQYRLHSGMRDRFTTFFHERTSEAQARAGMSVHGPFDVVGDDDAFVWFRGFPSLLERDRRKADFYQSRFWLEELQDEAFSMLVDYSNNVLVTPV